MKIIRKKARNPLAEDFAKTPSLEAEIEYRKLMVVEELLQFMKREGIKRTELAERMGVSPSRVTSMLSGESNLTIDTLVRAGRAVGANLHQTFAHSGHKVSWQSYPPADVHEAFQTPIQPKPASKTAKKKQDKKKAASTRKPSKNQTAKTTQTK